jgi:hypothetical protein
MDEGGRRPKTKREWSQELMVNCQWSREHDNNPNGLPINY